MLGSCSSGIFKVKWAMPLEKSLLYHAEPTPGKVSIRLTKPLETMDDLALAYTPGVADACRAIVQDPQDVFRYTNKGRMVAVISNGTAVLGLGDIGPLASKPVMEGKVALLKKFAGVDAIDVILDEKDPQKVIEVVRAISPTYGGINLEDIKAPECFIIERTLRDMLDIPVFHDDQHGTAVCVIAALQRAAQMQGFDFKAMKFVFSGAGASALASAELLRESGVPRDSIIMVDSTGVIFEGREENMNPYKQEFAVQTSARTLADALDGAHALIGLSSAGIVQQSMVARMHSAPIVFGLANPTPEITVAEVKAVAPQAIALTGRSDDPNQVNNVLCFPFLFRGVLDIRAKRITPGMRVAAAQALATIAADENKVIPNIMSSRLLPDVASAVAKAAQEEGVAALQWEIDAYHAVLSQEV